MRPLVKKMQSFKILKIQLIVGAITMITAMITLPLIVFIPFPSLIFNPVVVGILLVGMLMFALFAYFIAIRPYFIYRKLPDVLVETDGEYLYIHSKKQAKIPLSDIESANAFVDLPFLYSKEFIAVLLVHLVSEEYGDISLDISGYGSFKLYFVSNVEDTADELIDFINVAINSLDSDNLS